MSAHSGYNVIHWTPIQELGASKSAYSLADQHRMNPDFRSQSMIKAKRNCRLDDVAKIIDWLRDDHGVLSITDIVLNHTANESQWVRKNPDASYNCLNSPWLRPAFILDRLFWHLSEDIEDGRWESRGVTSTVNTSKQLDDIRAIFINEYLPLVNLEEFYMINVEQVIEDFEHCLLAYIYGDTAKLDSSQRKVVAQPQKNNTKYSAIEIVQDMEYKRLGSSINFTNALNLVLNEVGLNDSSNDSINRWIDFALLHVRSLLHKLNEEKQSAIRSYLHYAVDNVLKGAAYERIDSNGPKIPKVTRKTPLATEYFTDEVNEHNQDIIQIEQDVYDESKAFLFMAHNGWVMGDDPLKNFASQDSWVYLRRELVCWGDSIKLRFGDSPEDSPFLWSFMEEYVKQMASTFHGLRLDNCHSTPIHVAEHMLDAARRVNPDLYLIAELFTSSEDVDNIFVNKLGINSLIREAMSAGIPFELGRQVYRFGGEPVGSFLPGIPLLFCSCKSFCFVCRYCQNKRFEERQIATVRSSLSVQRCSCNIFRSNSRQSIAHNHAHCLRSDAIFGSGCHDLLSHWIQSGIRRTGAASHSRGQRNTNLQGLVGGGYQWRQLFERHNQWQTFHEPVARTVGNLWIHTSLRGSA